MSRTTAYYNELDPYAAQWLRNLIDAGHIAPGVVDTRSIEDVTPHDLHGFTQCHFFAGIGGWSLALRLAGWPDDRPVWTGSCPCQPFSAAGAGAGFADERHLWPAWFHLLEQCRPPVVFGEQVASKAVDAWIDLVHADLEGVGYQFGGVAFPAAGIGAPHIRDRNYWVAHSENHGQERAGPVNQPAGRDGITHRFAVGGVGHTDGERQGAQRGVCCGPESEPAGGCDADGMGNAERDGLRGGRRADADVIDESGDRPIHATSAPWPGPTNGQWGKADWLACRDGKWRPVSPGTFPLAYGVPGRVGRLRAYGNAIVPAQAAEFIRAALG